MIRKVGVPWECETHLKNPKKLTFWYKTLIKVVVLSAREDSEAHIWTAYTSQLIFSIFEKSFQQIDLVFDRPRSVQAAVQI